jgi:predicted Zn-dependent protease
MRTIDRLLLIGLLFGLVWGVTPIRAETQAGEAIYLGTPPPLTNLDDLAFGKTVHQMLEKRYGFIKDAAALKRVTDIGERLVAASDKPQTVLTYAIVKSDEINASATLGGYVFVYKGMLDFTKDDDAELASILAHELAHTQLRHIASMQYALRASQEAGEIKTPEELFKRLNASFSRQMEVEADAHGLFYFTRAGYNSDAAIRAFTKFQKVEGNSSDPKQLLLRTHPLTSERISNVQALRQRLGQVHGQFEAGVAALQTQNYDAAVEAFRQFLALYPRSVRAWCNLGTCFLLRALDKSPSLTFDEVVVYASPDQPQVRDEPRVDEASLRQSLAAFQRALEIDPNEPVALSSIAVALRRLGQPDKALAFANNAVKSSPKAAWWLINRGNVFFDLKQFKDAEKDYRTALTITPQMASARHNLGQLLLAQGKKAEAEKLLKEVAADPRFQANAKDALRKMGVSLALTQEPKEPVQTLGGIKIGMKPEQVRKLLGEPEATESLDAATSRWRYTERGLRLTLRENAVILIQATGSFEGEMEGGIGMGGTPAAAERAYGIPSAVNANPVGRTQVWDYSRLGFLLEVDPTTQKVVGFSVVAMPE